MLAVKCEDRAQCSRRHPGGHISLDVLLATGNWLETECLGSKPESQCAKLTNDPLPKPLATRLREEFLATERVLLPTLGFDFGVQVPHHYLAAAVGGLSLPSPSSSSSNKMGGGADDVTVSAERERGDDGAIKMKKILKRAWAVANSVMASPLVVRYPACLLAAGLLAEAAYHNNKFELPRLPDGRPWFAAMETQPVPGATAVYSMAQDNDAHTFASTTTAAVALATTTTPTTNTISSSSLSSPSSRLLNVERIDQVKRDIAEWTRRVETRAKAIKRSASQQSCCEGSRGKGRLDQAKRTPL